MTFQELTELIEKYDIPRGVHLMSNSGWECCATEMDGVFYNREANEIHFTQGFLKQYDYKDSDVGSPNGEHRDGWILLD